MDSFFLIWQILQLHKPHNNDHLTLLADFWNSKLSISSREVISASFSYCSIKHFWEAFRVKCLFPMTGIVDEFGRTGLSVLLVFERVVSKQC